MAKPKKPYAVGYKKPPVEHQFKPGQSGNPAGRPKERRNLKTLFQATANQEIEVNLGSKKVRMTRADAFFELVWKRTLSGEIKIWPMMLALMSQHYDDDDGSSGDPELQKQERELLNQLLALRDGGSDEPSTH